MSSPTSDDLSGRLLGRYRIRRLLGRGGMGSVYEAVQEDLGRVVALKVLDPVLATHDEQLERFRREATSAAALGHANIVSVTDFGARSTSGDPPYLVMELLSGESLGKLLDRESVLAPERVAFIASQVLAALGAAHGAGIVHRDVKPDNVFLVASDGGERPKLVDFGIAKVKDQTDRLTRAGELVGTPDYIAPEQLHGAQPDARTDIWAMGVTLYEALFGNAPFESDDIATTLHRVLHDPPLRVSSPRVDDTMWAILLRALDKSPERRFATAKEFADALRGWQALKEELGTNVTQTLTAPAPSPSLREVDPLRGALDTLLRGKLTPR